MPKYIDAEEIPSLFNEEYKCTRKLIEQGETHLDNLAEGFLEAKQVIDRMPSADVVEVKYGEWECIESDTSVDFRCSVCHRYRFHNGEMLRKYKFCPNCGAKMLPKLWR